MISVLCASFSQLIIWVVSVIFIDTRSAPKFEARGSRLEVRKHIIAAMVDITASELNEDAYHRYASVPNLAPDEVG